MSSKHATKGLTLDALLCRQHGKHGRHETAHGLDPGEPSKSAQIRVW